jgi:hypothetical protein
MIQFKAFHIDINDTLSSDVKQNNLIEYISIKKKILSQILNTVMN